MRQALFLASRINTPPLPRAAQSIKRGGRHACGSGLQLAAAQPHQTVPLREDIAVLWGVAPGMSRLGHPHLPASDGTRMHRGRPPTTLCKWTAWCTYRAGLGLIAGMADDGRSAAAAGRKKCSRCGTAATRPLACRTLGPSLLLSLSPRSFSIPASLLKPPDALEWSSEITSSSPHCCPCAQARSRLRNWYLSDYLFCSYLQGRAAVSGPSATFLKAGAQAHGRLRPHTRASCSLVTPR
jgi:hypothetical protein